MGDIKLKKGTGILFVMAVLFISSLLYLHYGDQNTLRVGIFYGSNEDGDRDRSSGSRNCCIHQRKHRRFR